MQRFARVTGLALLVAILASYLCDAIVLQIKVHHGTAYSAIEIDQILITPLKGQQEEYDLAGRTSVTCVRSLYHQLGYAPCWWVKRRNPPPK